MENLDFLTWFGMGSYGGLACSLLSAASIAAYALLRHRGSPRQIARALLVCLVGSCLILPAIWWNQNRLDLYGPAMDSREVLFWLSLTMFAGWCVPLGVLAGYLTLAGPQTLITPSMSGVSGLSTPAGASGSPDSPLASLGDPARHVEPLGAGRAWGQLVPLNGEFAGTPLFLSRRLTLLGREIDNDIVVDDDRTSRHHAEIHWDHGHVELVDRDSMNGTLVNRRTVRGRVPLQSSDVLDFGAQRYRFDVLAASNSASAAEEETRKMPGTSSERERVATPADVPLLLVGMNDTFAGKRWELQSEVVTIGRDAEHQVCLPHTSVSRRHAQIVRQRSGYYVSDLHSSNGTYLNGQAIAAPSLLMAGDILRAGEIELRCEAAPGPAPSQPGEADAVRTPVPAAEPTLSLYIGQSSAAAERAERPHLAPPRLTPSQPDLDAAE